MTAHGLIASWRGVQDGQPNMLEGDLIVRITSPTIRATVTETGDEPLRDGDIRWVAVRADDPRDAAH